MDEVPKSPPGGQESQRHGSTRDIQPVIEAL
jgi:hypothetical protein